MPEVTISLRFKIDEYHAVELKRHKKKKFNVTTVYG